MLGRKCVACNEFFFYDETQCRWDYENYTPAKIVRCPHCDCIQAVRYETEQDPNEDERFYFYSKSNNK